MAAWRGFLEAYRRVIDVLAAELETETGMPLGWYDVLVQLSEAPDRARRMQDLAGAVLLSKSGLSRLVDRMEAAGYVERRPCAEDGRGVLAALTDEGFAALRAAAPVHLRGVREHFVDRLPATDMTALARAFGRLQA